MKKNFEIYTCFLYLMAFVNLSFGMFLKPINTDQSASKSEKSNDIGDEWIVFQNKLGLTPKNVELLKSQRDPEATKILINRYLHENPHYEISPIEQNLLTETSTESPFAKFYRGIRKQLNLSKSTLKTSLHFEMADKPLKNLKRSRRKIAVKMVSDMPTDKINELLKVFNQEHGLDSEELEPDYPVENNEDTIFSLPTLEDPEYLYENLYEDEKDLTAPNKSSNSEYGSFQDLIMQATRNQWQRQAEETKLHLNNNNNNHFVS